MRTLRMALVQDTEELFILPYDICSADAAWTCSDLCWPCATSGLPGR